MKTIARFLAVAAAALALVVGPAHAAAILYDGSNGNLDLDVTSADASFDSGIASLGANTWTDPDTGSAGSNVTYVGGSISLQGATEGSWQGVVLQIKVLDSQNNTIAKLIGADSNSQFIAVDSNNATVSNLIALNSSFDFVFKLSDADWNWGRLDLFIGEAASSATEGTPTCSWTSAFANRNSGNPITGLEITFSNNGSNSATFTTSNIFSGTDWSDNPLIVPEPGIGALAVSGLLGLLIRRRR